jgi:hypothetical protein
MTAKEFARKFQLSGTVTPPANPGDPHLVEMSTVRDGVKRTRTVELHHPGPLSFGEAFAIIQQKCRSADAQRN